MIEVTAICAFHDNYIWAIVQKDTGQVAVVDPGDATPVQQFLQQHDYQLNAILITHHHPDHTGGIAALTRSDPVPVYGPKNEAIPGCSHAVSEGDRVTLANLKCSFDVIDIPGHTRGHIAYYSAPHLFCGDTLFAAGCGRIFEGNPQQMLHSLKKLAALTNDTQVYCAHEYTQANLNFATRIEPSNEVILQRLHHCQTLRASNQPTLPSTIGLEKTSNPFLRCHLPAVIAQAQKHCPDPIQSELEAFTFIREWKNRS